MHTFGIGNEHAPTLVLPGLPVNADTWATVVTALGCARVMDLPGLGMSSGSPRDWAAWLTAQIDTFSSVHLVGHSIGAAAVMEVAAADPDRIGSITLVAPFFSSARCRILRASYRC